MTQITIRNVDGRDWLFDDDVITVKQAIAIKLTCGWNLEEFERAFAEFDPRAVQAMWWRVLQQNGVTMPIADVDFDMMSVLEPFVDAIKESQAAQAATAAPEAAELPPTLPAGPPSPESPSPPATTLTPPVLPEVAPVTVS